MLEKKVKSRVKLAIITTLLFGVFFYVLKGNYSIKSLLISMSISGLYAFGLGFGQGALNDFLSTKWNWVTQTNKRIAIGIIATILYTIPIVLGIHYILYIILERQSKELFFKEEMVWQHVFWIVFSFGFSAFIHARSFMLKWKESAKEESTQQQIVAKTESAKFETLKNQIDPHFLFNSLNVLTSLIGENPKQAEKFTVKLSKIYRYVLEQRNKELVPIREELEFAKVYMELLQMRFEEALEFEIPKNISNPDLKLVPLSLQLLLENAVKHNIVSTSKPLQIKIYEEKGFLKITNSKNTKETLVESTKVGLQNITDRYGLISKTAIQIENDSKQFTVSLPLLLKTDNIMNTTKSFENSNYVKAVKRVEKLKIFYKKLVVYVIMIPVLVFINLRFSSGFHWFWFPLLGWGTGLFFKGLDAYGYDFLLVRKWEEKKIKKIMKKDKL